MFLGDSFAFARTNRVTVRRPQVETLEARLAPSAVQTASDEDDYDPTKPKEWAGKNGQLSLREAIREINERKGGVISFSGPMTINISMGQLPPITSTVTIAGQADGQGNPQVILSGGGGNGNGIMLSKAPGSVVRQMAINGFAGTGIIISQSSGTIVENCRIGTDASGTSAAANGSEGIAIDDSARCLIQNNVLSGNGRDGLDIDGAPASGNRIFGNKIGVDVTGQKALANGADGIWIGSGARSNLIGNGTDATRNIISRNGQNGVTLDRGATKNKVQGNYIGVAQDGTTTLGNGFCGVDVPYDGSGNIIGGTSDGARNIIAANGLAGVRLAGTSSGNKIEGNYIGFDKSGTGTTGGNGALGIFVLGTSTKNVIGGTSPAKRNVIGNNPSAGISLGAASSNNKVEGNFIGVDKSGATNKAPNGAGVRISTISHDNIIGGSSSARNIISGNDIGIEINGGATGNRVMGNYIGLDASGQGLGNGSTGVKLSGGANGNRIGDPSSAKKNLIDKNGADGILITDTGTSNNEVIGNFIGLAADGSTEVGNGQDGVKIDAGASNNVIGGSGGSRNVISRNGFAGIEITGTGTSGNQVLGNFIGTDSTGSTSKGNGAYGVTLENGAIGNIIGGVGGRNIINGSPYGVSLTGAQTMSNQVTANYIGTNVSGKATLDGTTTGIFLSGVSSNQIGNSSAGGGNVIAGATGDGIVVTGGAHDDFINGNKIGTDASGKNKLQNGNNGIAIDGSSTDIQIEDNIISGNGGNGVQATNSTHINLTNNQIGTDAAGKLHLGNGGNGINFQNTGQNFIGTTSGSSGNIIAYNGGIGVSISGAAGTIVQGNSIFGNGLVGISLAGSGNNNEPTPALTSAASGILQGKATLTIHGTIALAAGTVFHLDLYTNKPGTSVIAQGQKWIGSVDVTVDATGHFTANYRMSKPAAGTILTLTATDDTNGTSAFSAGVTL